MSILTRHLFTCADNFFEKCIFLWLFSVVNKKLKREKLHSFLRWYYLRKSNLGAAIKSFLLSHLHGIWMHYFILPSKKPWGVNAIVILYTWDKAEAQRGKMLCSSSCNISSCIIVLQYWLPHTMVGLDLVTSWTSGLTLWPAWANEMWVEGQVPILNANFKAILLPSFPCYRPACPR